MPMMQGLFQTRSIAMTDGAIVIGAGLALLLVLEIEKCIRLSLAPPIVRPRESTGQKEVV